RDRFSGTLDPVRLFLSLEEFGPDQPVVQRPGFARLRVLAPFHIAGKDESAKLGGRLLAVSVDPAVALLDADQRPGQVVVDELVALLMQIDAFGGDVTGEEKAHRIVAQTELLDDPLLFVLTGGFPVHDLDGAAVGQPALGLTLSFVDLPGCEAEHLRNGPSEPWECGDAFGEDDDPRVGSRSDAEFFQLPDERAELRGVLVLDAPGQGTQVDEGLPLGAPSGLGSGGVLPRCATHRLVEGVDPGLDRLLKRLVRGEECLEQVVGDELLAADGRGVRVTRDPPIGESLENRDLLVTGLCEYRLRWPAVGPDALE